ncbi:MAG: anhydro-N-acetylmuramic acid kinase [Thiohalomonadales bacterium]
MIENYIGLMSGTSADCIDAVIISIENNKLTLIDNYSHSIPKNLQEKIWLMNSSSMDELKSMLELDYQLGDLFAEAVNQLLKKTSINKETIIAIGSHGQTVRHYPDSEFPSTLQIGDANLIVERTNITTVCDFRRADIAAGGQGAPLVPAFHQFQFQHDKKNRIILNIGGIANITYLPANQPNFISGFDTGPGNALMDEWIQKHKSLDYDKNGEWAKTGKLDYNLLKLFLEHPYFQESPPKSTGRDIFNLNWVESILEHYRASKILNTEDVQTTLCALTAHSIFNAIQTLNNIDELYVCGGGIHNLFLINMLQELLSEKNISCESTENLGLNPDWVEACAFAWLARQRLNNLPGNCPSVTGARHRCILGAVYGKL